NYTYNSADGSISPGADGIIDIYTPVTKQIPDPADPTKPYSTQVPGLNPFTGHIEGPPLYQSSANAYGLVGFFPVVGNPSGFGIENTSQSQFTAQYSVQVGSHFLTAGFDGNLMSIFNYSDQLPYDANPFKDSFLVHPYTGDIYATDKMEFSDITFAPGVRFDVYQPNSNQIPDLYNPIYGGALTPTKLQTQVSPRIAITYAVTDQTTFNFGYNWYFKEPNLSNVLLATGGGNLYDLQASLNRGNQIIGDAGLQAERTKEVDVGFNTQLSDVFAFSVTGIYKDLRNEADLASISSPLLPQSYFFYTDDGYGNDRAIEIVAEKTMANNWSLKANYTYQLAQGTSSSAAEAYSAFLNQDPNSEQAVLPLTPFPFSYDRTNVADILFNVNYNKDEGPTIFGKKLLEWFALQTTTLYQTGTPYTALNLKGAQVGSFNGNREPDEFQTDAMLTRTIPFGDVFGASMSSLFLDLQLEVTNIFNRTTPLYVYPTTGQGDNDGSLGQLGGTAEYYNDPTNSRGSQIDALGNLYYNPRLDLNHDGRVSLAEQQVAYTQYRTDNFNRRAQYQIPRRVYLNFTIRF
ncbi:MAG TPA: TonB-dependent receptor, partial [Candidatus Kapabacteria bacterium]|nr:TonB-dependent receptor [Candidatus Kapabacteria bacterium]